MRGVAGEAAHLSSLCGKGKGRGGGGGWEGLGGQGLEGKEGFRSLGRWDLGWEVVGGRFWVGGRGARWEWGEGQRYGEVLGERSWGSLVGGLRWEFGGRGWEGEGGGGVGRGVVGEGVGGG